MSAHNRYDEPTYFQSSQSMIATSAAVVFIMFWVAGSVGNAGQAAKAYNEELARKLALQSGGKWGAVGSTIHQESGNLYGIVDGGQRDVNHVKISFRKKDVSEKNSESARIGEATVKRYKGVFGPVRWTVSGTTQFEVMEEGLKQLGLNGVPGFGSIRSTYMSQSQGTRFSP